jgi:hypothetical protein
MNTRRIQFVILIVLGGMILAFHSPLAAPVSAQQPTGSIPTVTGTPMGAIIAIDPSIPFVNVYSGPSRYLYPAIGLLLAEQEAPAYGYSEDQQWIQIYYPGVPNSVAWVYAPYVKIVKIGELPLVEAPPTPTPAFTPIVDIDPTLIAAFITPAAPTRLPTFTPPVPLVVATFVDNETTNTRIPIGLLILGFGFVGALGTIISFLRGR